MKKPSFNEAIAKILKDDTRYDEMAYHFMREALDYTVKMLSKPVDGPGRHVSGAELLEGTRQYALQEYGPMAKTVLNRWGIQKCEEFGEIVFNMVEKGLLGKTEEDRREDFTGGYDFDQAFCEPFKPTTPSSKPRPRSEKEKR